MPQHDVVFAMMRPVRHACGAGYAGHRGRLLLGLSLVPVAAGFGAGRAIEDVRISRTGVSATADVDFPCQVRYLGHTPRGTGATFQIRLSLGETCREEIGSGLRSELYEPPGRDLAGIQQLAFHTGAANEAILTVSFGRPTTIDVSQGRARNTIRVVTAAQPSTLDAVPSTVPPPASPAPETIPLPAPPVSSPTPPPTDAVEPDREPLRLVQPVPFEPAERFVVQLSTQPEDSVDVALPNELRDRILYVNEVSAGTRRWEELRIGFFDSESEARSVVGRLSGEFPDALVAVAGLEEQARALADPLAAAEAAESLEAAGPDAEAVAPAEPLDVERATALGEEARAALLAGDYERSIRIYTRLLEDPDYGARAEARELLGVSRERNGQLAHARTEYRAYLAEFPDGADAQRVRQRLAGLVGALDAPPVQRLRPTPEAAAPEGGWDFTGGVSQYFRRDVVQLRDDEPQVLGQSGLHSRVDFLARREGERFDLLGRANAAYYYDLRPTERGPEDQGLVSNAYLEITDRQLDLRTVVGRQSLYRSGILGRFDGAHASYRWRPDIALNVTAGFPVDSPRHLAETGRHFYAMSADLDDLVGDWDFSFFGHLQRVDGLADREAIGGEAHWRDDRWQLVGALDIDLSYEVLNSALLIANWRATDRVTLNGRLNVRAAPFLTTRNALMGQPAETIEELELMFTEPEIRRLARNRTAQARSATVGFSMPVSQRFHFNGDLTYSETDATVASGGVDVVPGTGPQYFYSASLVGSSLFNAGDTVVFGFRHVESLEALITSLSFDLRLPLGARLRLNPRIGVSVRDGQRTGVQQWIAAPRLRAIYRWGRRHRFEAEIGGEWSNRDLPATDPSIRGESQDGSAHFLNLGYWMEF